MASQAPQKSVVVSDAPRRAEAEGESGAHSRVRGAAFYVSPEDRAREERIVKAFRAGKRWPRPARREPLSVAANCNPMLSMEPEEILDAVEDMRARGWNIHPRRYLQFVTHGAE